MIQQVLARLAQSEASTTYRTWTQLHTLAACTPRLLQSGVAEQQTSFTTLASATRVIPSQEPCLRAELMYPATLNKVSLHSLHTVPSVAADNPDDSGHCCDNHDHDHHHHHHQQRHPGLLSHQAAAQAGNLDEDDELSEEERTKQIEEAHLAESMERLIMEAYKLLQKGDMQQAESLLLEGSLALDQGMGGGSATHPRQAEIYDQLSLFQFLQGKLREAEVSARRSLAVIQNHFEMEDPAVSMCELRLGTILFSMGQYREAQTLITESYNGLKAALGEAAQVVGESQYYLALMPLLTANTEDAVALTDPMLLQGLRNMRTNAGAGPLLVQAALREHNRLVDLELTSERWDKAAWLFRQEIRLRNGVDPASEDLSLLLYQFATLQYTRGLYDEAEALAQFSLDIAKSVYRNDENQTMLRRHRLGTVLDCKGNPEEANKLLTQSFNHFDKRLGPKNPLTGEAQFALALSGLRRMLLAKQSEGGMDIYSRVLAPKQQQDLMQQMQKGLQSMQAGFGADHMLVKKALIDYADTSSALRSM